MADPPTAAKMVSTFRSEAAKVGMKMNNNKTQVIVSAAANVEPARAALAAIDINVEPVLGGRVLGAYLGTTALKETFLKAKVDSAKALMQKIASMEDTQCVFAPALLCRSKNQSPVAHDGTECHCRHSSRA